MGIIVQTRSFMLTELHPIHQCGIVYESGYWPDELNCDGLNCPLLILLGPGDK